MSLQPGARLGPYEILEAIGAGGMGEVYRARDARLGRDVAIKILPPAFSSDADRLSRFEQEAPDGYGSRLRAGVVVVSLRPHAYRGGDHTGEYTRSRERLAWALAAVLAIALVGGLMACVIFARRRRRLTPFSFRSPGLQVPSLSRRHSRLSLLTVATSRGTMMAAGIDAATDFQATVPVPLFRTTLAASTTNHPYVVTRDGARFLVAVVERATPTPLTVRLNWPASLQK